MASFQFGALAPAVLPTQPSHPSWPISRGVSEACRAPLAAQHRPCLCLGSRRGTRASWLFRDLTRTSYGVISAPLQLEFLGTVGAGGTSNGGGDGSAGWHHSFSHSRNLRVGLERVECGACYGGAGGSGRAGCAQLCGAHCPFVTHMQFPAAEEP